MLARIRVSNKIVRTCVRSCSFKVNGLQLKVPTQPVVALCLNGSNQDYFEAAANQGLMPRYTEILSRDEGRGRQSLTTAAVPTLSIPNNVAIVCGKAPLRTGVSGSYYLDDESGDEVVMNDSALLRSESILSALSNNGVSVTAIFPNDFLVKLLSVGVNNESSLIKTSNDLIKENNGNSSTHQDLLPLDVCVEMINERQNTTPQFYYLSLDSDRASLHEPGSNSANSYYEALDERIGRLDDLGVTVGLTASHGVNEKCGFGGKPKVVFAEDVLEQQGVRCRVVMPNNLPNDHTPSALSSFASVYLDNLDQEKEAMGLLRELPGVYTVMNRREAARAFELPADRIGDLVVVGDVSACIGRKETDHDLSDAQHLRSGGGLEEQVVPMFINRPLIVEYAKKVGRGRVRNYDFFDILLNGPRA